MPSRPTPASLLPPGAWQPLLDTADDAVGPDTAARAVQRPHAAAGPQRGLAAGPAHPVDHRAPAPDHHADLFATAPRQRRAAAPHLPARPARQRRPRSRRLPLHRLAAERWPDAVADAAAGRHRPGQFALHEQFGLCRQRAADRPGRAAAARLAGCRPGPPAAGRCAAHRLRHHGAPGAWRGWPRPPAPLPPAAAPHTAPTSPPSASSRPAGWTTTRCSWPSATPPAGPTGPPGPTAWPSARPPRWTPPAPAMPARIAFWQFCQWCFFRQWAALRAHAHARGVKIIGDAPIFIAHQSAEVWARQTCSCWTTLAGRPWWPACRPTTSAPPASAGATRCTAGRPMPPKAMPGGSNGCGARWRWSTSCASTTSAALPTTGRSRPASPRLSTAAGCPARAWRCSTPSTPRWARCR
jgi:hypothetical protein